MRLFLSDGRYIETQHPLDISIPLSNDKNNPRAWYVNPPRFEPVRANGFIGSRIEGGAVNFRDIYFNPHGHGTHTECLGHITEEIFSVNQTLKKFICIAELISVEPTKTGNTSDGKDDHVITLSQFKSKIPEKGTEAIIIRTLPNMDNKKHMDYSSSNPPYIEENCIEFFDEYKIVHLLIDLPSVDREEDGGILAFHHAFWKVPNAPDHNRTITEMIYVDSKIPDGTYLLELQMAPFENDASPSRPVLYEIFRP